MKTTKMTWIEDHFDQLKYFASPHPLWNLVILVPLAAGLVWSASVEWFIDSTWSAMAFFVIGVFVWTFLEYAIHRWIYHGQIKNESLRRFIESFHMYHHRNIEDTRVLNAGPLMIIPLAVVILGPLFFIFHGKTGLFASIGLGILSAYYFYEWVHYLIHRPKMTNSYLRYISRFHLFHHEQRWNKNFGNTNHFWDWLLGTYDGNYNKPK